MANQKRTERINPERAKFLLSLTNKERESLIWVDDDNNNQGEKFYDKKTYLKLLVNYLKKQLANNCELQIEYNYSKKMRTDGRLFAQEFSLQSMKKNLRGFLVGNDNNEYYYADYDIVNCHPSIVGFILLNYSIVDDDEGFKEEYPYLYEYTRSSASRDDFLDRADCTKQQIVTMLNSCYNTEIYNQYAVGIDKEFKRIQKIVFDFTPDKLKEVEHFKGSEREPNKRGSFLNKVMCIVENCIIHTVIDYYEEQFPFQDIVSTLMFDGLHITTQIDNQVDALNELTGVQGIEWAKKEFDTSIQESELYLKRDETSIQKIKSKDYKTVKADFEENHFMIEDIVLFLRESTLAGKPIVCTYSATDFKTLTKPIKYYNAKMDEVPIFDRWVGDETRRRFKKMDFIPTEEKNEEVYNTFRGFDYSNYKSVKYEKTDELINILRKTISTLVDHNQECVDSTTRRKTQRCTGFCFHGRVW